MYTIAVFSISSRLIFIKAFIPIFLSTIKSQIDSEYYWLSFTWLKWHFDKEMIRYTVLKTLAKKQIRKGVDGTRDLPSADVNNARHWSI